MATDLAPEFLRWLWRRYRVRFAKADGVSVWIQDKTVAFEPFSTHPADGFMPLGSYSYSGCVFGPVASIGRYCSIGTGILVMGDRHPLEWVSTSPVFYKDRRGADWNAPLRSTRERFDGRPEPVEIGSDVWIGDHVLIRGGTVIGTGSVIGAGSVITRDVAPYTVVGGAPARVIRSRFSESLCEGLLQSEWWTFAADDLADLPIEDPVSFISAFEAIKGKVAPDNAQRRSLKQYEAEWRSEAVT